MVIKLITKLLKWYLKVVPDVVPLIADITLYQFRVCYSEDTVTPGWQSWEFCTESKFTEINYYIERMYNNYETRRLYVNYQ